MHNKFNRKRFIALSLFCVSLCYLCLVSCKDDYYYDEKEPDFLRGNTTIIWMKVANSLILFVWLMTLIIRMYYKRPEVKLFSRQRMKHSSAFLKQNTQGIRSYEMLSMPMKRMIMNSSMINMAYLSGMLSNLTVSGEGPATADFPKTQCKYLSWQYRIY